MTSLEKVVPELVEFVAKELGKDIPRTAAGGIWDRKDMEWAFGLGAKGVQIGTRFACTFEGDAADRFAKQAHIDARAEDVVLIQSPAGSLAGLAVSVCRQIPERRSGEQTLHRQLSHPLPLQIRKGDLLHCPGAD